MDKTFGVLGALSACLAVAAGAFGAHGLRERISVDMLGVYEVAVRYHMYHSLALFAVAWAASRWPGPAVQLAGWLFLAGMVIFSGSLYVLSLTGVKWLGAITPIGGLALLVGWFALAWGIWK